MKKYRTISSPSILYGFDKNKKLVPIRKMKSGVKFFGKPASILKNPMIAVVNPNKKLIIGFFNEKDVENVFSAEGDAPKAKNFTQKLTSPEVLWTAGGGALLGFALGQLTGANKISTTAIFAVIGGAIGFGSSSEKTMSAEGRRGARRTVGLRKPVSASIPSGLTQGEVLLSDPSNLPAACNLYIDMIKSGSSSESLSSQWKLCSKAMA